MEITQPEEKRKEKKNEDSLRDFWNNVKHTNIHYSYARRKRNKGTENIFEDIIDENCSNL